MRSRPTYVVLSLATSVVRSFVTSAVRSHPTSVVHSRPTTVVISLFYTILYWNNVDRTLSIAARLRQAGYLTRMDVVKILIVVEVRLFQ